MVRRFALSLAVACAAGSAWARPAAAAGALETVAPEIARGLGAVPQGTVVVAAPLASDQPTVKGDDLAVRLAALLAGKLGAATRAHPQAAQLGTARAVSGKGGALVYVSTELVKGELRATADLYPVMSNGWDRVRIPAPPPRAHAFGAAPIDAEVRAFLPAIPLEQASVRRARHDEGDVLAAACGDLNGDGGMEIALVSRARVAVGRVRAGRFVAERAAPWASIASRAPVPLREPLAGAAFQPRAAGLFVGITDRGGASLDADLTARSGLRGVPVASREDACAEASPEASAFDGDVTTCSPTARDPTVRASPPAPRYDAVAIAEIVARDGRASLVVAAREPGGKLRVKIGDQEGRPIDGAGAQVAIGDLDQDGAPDVATSLDAPPADDAVQIVTYAGDGPRARKKIPAPGGVRALAVCPPEDRGAPALIAVVGAEVWVVR